MRFTLMSDLHLEFGDLVLPGGDVLLLAGDICEAARVRRETYDPNGIMVDAGSNARPRADRYYRFFEEECSKYQQVFMIMGNHEHYGFTFNKTESHLVSNLPTHVQVLNRDSVDLGDVVLVGVTLWTDLNKNDPQTELHLEGVMNDYRKITILNESAMAYHRLRARSTYHEHVKDLDFINTATQDASRKYIVMGHHAPSKLSVKPRFKDDHLTNGGYSSDLSEFILDRPQIRAWCHGHCHDQFKYQVGDTWILCNPRGYVGYEDTGFEPRQFDIVDNTVVFDEGWHG